MRVTTKQLINNFPGMSEDDRALLRKALSSRGPTKDMLRKVSPAYGRDRLGWAAWQSMAGYMNPQVVQTWTMMLASAEAMSVYTHVESLMKMQLKDLPLWWWMRVTEPAFRWNADPLGVDREIAMVALHNSLNEVH